MQLTEAVGRTVAMVLAGGEGERLSPLTRDRAKPAVPFAGNMRLIDFTLSNCLNSGIRRVHVLTQYKSDSLNRHIRLGWNIFNPELGEYIEVNPPQLRLASTWYLGTADAIYQNIYTLQRERPAYVLILSGDHVYRMDYSRLLARHIESEAVCTIACKLIPQAQARRFGVLSTDTDGRVLGFREKPERPAASELARGLGFSDFEPFSLCSMGVYVFNTEVLVKRIIEDAKRRTSHDFGRDVIPAMIERDDKIMAYNFYDKANKCLPYWRDIGTLDAFHEANIELATGKTVDGISEPLSLYDMSWPFRSYVSSAPPLNILCGSASDKKHENEICNSLLSNGVVIKDASILNSVIGPRVFIEDGADIENSVIHSNVRVGSEAVIKNAIIDKYNQIPSKMEIGVDIEVDRHAFTVSEGGVVAVPKDMPFNEM